MTGMLWFDNDPKRPLEDKVQRAAQHYQVKNGRAPNLCCVHPSLAKVEKIGEVTIRAMREVMPNHFLIGVEDRHVVAG